VYSLRRRLGDLGRVRFDMAPEGEIDAWLDMLNQLHATRWGETAFSGARLHFHREFARALSRQGRLALSRLWIGDRVVSVLYDVRGRQAQYNLQMGFDGQLGARVSLGLLHLGYAMEDASTRGLGYYDFLAGPGRSTQYKARLGQAPGAICSTQLITAPWLGGLHRAYDFVSRAN
jgi:CelD/BcsL family acetyltransferase involved in cellulose biosynthesis